MDYEYFPSHELECPCCGVNGMNPFFMERLIMLRKEADFPFIPTSAYRCPIHNRNKGGKKLGAHPLGRGIDIHCYGERAYKLVMLAPSYGFTGIGLAQKGAFKNRYIHLDDLPIKDPSIFRPTIWTY